MAGKTRSSFLSLIIIAVMFFGAASPATAFADDRKPPDTPPAEASNGGAATTGSDAEAASTPAPTTTEATSTPDEAPAQAGSEGNVSNPKTAHRKGTPKAAPHTPESISTLPADSSVLGQVPENTSVMVLNVKGQSQPLATKGAADAIATSDPIWCPQGQAPTPGANGCTTSFSSFNELLTFLSGNASYSGAGTIYVQQGAYNGGEASIDFNSPAYNLSNIMGSDLTITGGWNTSTNTVDSTSTSNFNVPLLIGTSGNPWGGSLTINNITINKTSGTGLTLYAQNDITVANVTVTNSVNGAGTELHAGGDVNVNNSKFDRNKTAGAIIQATGNVAIANSSFSNPANGRRQVTGLGITSGGTVSLANVVANENREAGANINANGRVSISNSVFSGTKAMKGSGASTTFLGYGLQIVTPDSIDLSGVTASDNFLWGGSLKAGGDVAITDSIFNANTTASPGFIDDTGLLVTSGGTVSLNNVQANDNRLIGATINATGDVSVNNSTFTNNKGTILSSNGTPTFYGYGLNVVTSGGVFLNNVNASNNTLFGAHLEAGSDVAVSNSNFDNQTSGSATDQTGRGLEIISGGNVFLSNISVSNNQTFGANIQAAGAVFLDTLTATNNALDGVDVKGNCTTVTLNAGTYSNNGGYGLSIVDASLDQTSAPVFTGNGAGDIFQDPGSCVFSAPAGGSNGGGGTGTGSTTSNQTASHARPAALKQNAVFHGEYGLLPVPSTAAKGMTLDSFLANSSFTKEDTHLSIFTGQYAYLYNNYVLHIVTFPGSLTMTGS